MTGRPVGAAGCLCFPFQTAHPSLGTSRSQPWPLQRRPQRTLRVRRARRALEGPSRRLHLPAENDAALQGCCGPGRHGGGRQAGAASGGSCGRCLATCTAVQGSRGGTAGDVEAACVEPAGWQGQRRRRRAWQRRPAGRPPTACEADTPPPSTLHPKCQVAGSLEEERAAEPSGAVDEPAFVKGAACPPAAAAGEFACSAAVGKPWRPALPPAAPHQL